ncbi:hypothetical protein PCANC_25659 [Puccinia coronata f. sp. avenae]|uniref:Uncharacterized protein n=1 Tax=Puccinia coronata f. sp. avenae TaxID=200324 RepID=A0A2N5SCB7_9BASI|nr:hypothetical protein PCANC_25659 [Puccinia coronata f. sp. avenae]
MVIIDRPRQGSTRRELLLEVKQLKESSGSTTPSAQALPRAATSSEENVHPSENFELIQHYLKLLRLRKEQELANYQPSAWELLSHKEKLEIVNKRLILIQDFCPHPQEARAQAQLEERVNSLKLQMITRKETAPQVLNKEEEDQDLGERAHIALEPIRGSPDQRSYRGTQGLIEQRPRDAEITSEIDSQEGSEEYVKGWNPWKVKAEIFPSPKGKGKKRSSSSQEMRGHYNNPQKWKQLTSLGKTLMSAYNSM